MHGGTCCHSTSDFFFHCQVCTIHLFVASPPSSCTTLAAGTKPTMFHPQWQKAEGDCMRQEPQHRVLTAYYAPTMTVAVWKAIFCFCFFSSLALWLLLLLWLLYSWLLSFLFPFWCFWLLVILDFVVSWQYAATILVTTSKASKRTAKTKWYNTTMFYKKGKIQSNNFIYRKALITSNETIYTQYTQ